MIPLTYPALLSRLRVAPVLVDVGAAGAPPAIWRGLAPGAIYVGFDPDRREMPEQAAGGFGVSHILDRAVTDGDAAEAHFYLTRAPQCSSTLRPNAEALTDYLFAELFEVVGQFSAPAIRLGDALAQLGLPAIDWLKLDTQGTDLRILLSLDEAARGRLLAVDLEPGLIDAYIGEDGFADVHRAMLREGFWLSQMHVRGVSRAHPPASSVGRALLWHAVRPSPGWCEVRYLRTVEWLRRQGLEMRAYVLLWAFALADDQPAFALEVAAGYESAFGAGGVARQMRLIALLRMAARLGVRLPGALAGAALRRIGRA